MNIINLIKKGRYCLEPDSILNIDRALMESCDNLRIIQVFLEDYLYYEAAHCSLAYQYINQVPVFLVSKELVGKYFDIDFVGHHLKFTVPNDNLPTEDLNGDVESILGKDWKREEVALNIDLWGLYIGIILEMLTP